MFTLDCDFRMHFICSVPVEGNVIDFIILQNQGTILYSMDTVHRPFSTTAVTSERDQQTRPSVGTISFSSIHGSHEDTRRFAKLISSMENRAKDQPFVSQEAPGKGRSLREMLYGLESLRKRGEEGNDDRDD